MLWRRDPFDHTRTIYVLRSTYAFAMRRKSVFHTVRMSQCRLTEYKMYHKKCNGFSNTTSFPLSAIEDGNGLRRYAETGMSMLSILIKKNFYPFLMAKIQLAYLNGLVEFMKLFHYLTNETFS